MLTFMISQDVDGAEAHFQKIARTLGVPDDSSFSRLGVSDISPLNHIGFLSSIKYNKVGHMFIYFLLL